MIWVHIGRYIRFSNTLQNNNCKRYIGICCFKHPRLPQCGSQKEQNGTNQGPQEEERDRNSKHICCFENRLCVDLDNNKRQPLCDGRLPSIHAKRHSLIQATERKQ
jgi:hypothetical protein